MEKSEKLNNLKMAISLLGLVDHEVIFSKELEKGLRGWMERPLPISSGVVDYFDIWEEIAKNVETPTNEFKVGLVFDHPKLGECRIDCDHRVEVYSDLRLSYLWWLASEAAKIGLRPVYARELDINADIEAIMIAAERLWDGSRGVTDHDKLVACHEEYMGRMRRVFIRGEKAHTSDGHLTAGLHFWKVWTGLDGEVADYPLNFGY